MPGTQVAVYPSAKRKIQYFPWISMDLAPRRLLVIQLVKLCLHGRVKVRELGVKDHQRTGHREHCTENEGERWETVD